MATSSFFHNLEINDPIVIENIIELMKEEYCPTTDDNDNMINNNFMMK